MARRNIAHFGKKRGSGCEKRVMKITGRSLNTARRVCRRKP